MRANQTVSQGLKTIFQRLAEHQKKIILLSVLGVISALSNGLVPYLTGRFFDSIISPSGIAIGSLPEVPLFAALLFLWLIIQIIANLVDWRNNLESRLFGETIYVDYMIGGFGKLLELPMSFHKNKSSGKTFDQIQRAAMWYSRIVENVILDLAPQFLSVLVALIVSFLVNWLFASVMLAGLIIYVFVIFKKTAPLAALQQKVNKTYGEAFGGAFDAVANVQAIKQAVAEKYEQKKLYKNFYLKASGFWKEMTTIHQNMRFLHRLIIIITQLFVFSLAVYFIFQNKLTLGELLMFNGYALMLFGPFTELAHNWQTVQNGVVAMEKSERITNRPPENYTPANAVILPELKGGIIFQNVFFAYNKKDNLVLKDISFSIDPGEVVALVGESGVGKSTLIDLISAYHFPQQGRVLIDGHDVKNLDLKFLRKQIAVVPQELVLFDNTVGRNIKYGTFAASDKKMEEAARKSHADEFIGKFPKKYRQLVGERGIKLSVGQKQRLAIARAVLRDPKILILDEPTSALDAKSEKLIQASLEKLMAGRTTIIIAHRLSTVRKADKIIVFKDGRVVETGRHQSLLKIKNGVYRELYEAQFEIKSGG